MNRDGSVVSESAIIVGVVLPEQQFTGDPLEELDGLAETAGAHVVGQLVQKRQKPDYATYLGKGKGEELSQLVAATDADELDEALSVVGKVARADCVVSRRSTREDAELSFF